MRFSLSTANVFCLVICRAGFYSLFLFCCELEYLSLARRLGCGLESALLRPFLVSSRSAMSELRRITARQGGWVVPVHGIALFVAEGGGGIWGSRTCSVNKSRKPHLPSCDLERCSPVRIRSLSRLRLFLSPPSARLLRKGKACRGTGLVRSRYLLYSLLIYNFMQRRCDSRTSKSSLIYV